jgi:serine phosphatase RsbU (regulator of sigma subunit)/Tfp pilus assembly protein PilF
MKNYIILAIGIFCFSVVYAKDISIDKLKSELNNEQDDTARIHLMNTLSFEYAKKGVYSKSNDYAVKALELAKEKEYKRGIINSYIQLGITNERQGNYLSSLEHYMNVLILVEEIKDKQSILKKVYNSLGNVYMYLSDYPKSLRYHLKSLEIKEELNDQEGIAKSYNNIGTVYHKLGELNKAKEFYIKSFEIVKERKNKKAVAGCYNNIGVIYKEKREFEKALDYFFKSIEIYENIGNQKEIASIYNNIGFIFDMNGKSEKALEYYKKSLEINQKTGSKAGIADSYIQIGKYYNALWEYKKAIHYLENALQIGKQIKSLDIIQAASFELSIAYENIKDFEEAYNAFKLYTAVNDRIKDEEKIKRFAQLEMQHDFNKKQKEREFILKRQKMITWFSLTGLFLMILLAIVIFRSYKRKKQDNRLLEQKNKEIEKQRDIAASQRDKITEQKQEITDSINYASKIQSAILPPDDFLNNVLPEHFIFFLPRDIVSGDFYWSYQKDGKVYISAVDCTGHGVPGAFMSMLGVSFLNEIVNKKGIEHAADILNELKRYVIMYLHQDGKEGKSKDGMDIAIIIMDMEQRELEFAGAFNPLYYIRNGEISQVKADRMPIGIYPVNEPFTNHVMQMQKGDCYYIFSDGYVDQFGAEDGSKLKARKFKNILLSNYQKPMNEQKKLLQKNFYSWKGEIEQVDDIIVIGIRV